MADDTARHGANVSEALVELQEADLLIMRAKRRFETCSEKDMVASVKSKLHEASISCGKLSDMKTEVEDHIAEVEKEDVMLKEKISEVTEILKKSTDSRMVTAYTKQREGTTRRLEKVDYELTQQLTRLEKIDGVYQQALAKRDELSAGLEAAQAAYRKVAENAAADIKAAQVRRQQAAESLPAELLTRYSEIAAKRGGIAVGTYDGSCCSACNVEFNEGERARIAKGADITVCPGCGRILIVR